MMKEIEVYKDNKKVFATVKVAKSFIDRFQGLMMKENMGDMDGLVIEYCNSIHTFFMKFPIDVFFLDDNNKIVKEVRALKPWRMTRAFFKARKVLETYPEKDGGLLREGDVLEFKCLN